jgi:hypothetical protein
MHDVRFGHNKPRFRLLGEKLSLERSTVEEKLIAPIPPQSKELDQKDLEDPAFKEELHALGAALVREMQKVSQDQGAQFVLITEHERSLPHILEGSVMMLDVKAALNAQNLQLPKSLAHINASANTVLAWEIARFLQSNHLIPDNHRR